MFLNNDTFIKILEGTKLAESNSGGVDIIGDVSKIAIQRLDEQEYEIETKMKQ